MRTSVADASAMPAEKTPYFRWTGSNGKVRAIKCVDRDGRAYGGVQYPERGPVVPDHWSREPTIESGGIFCWAWLLHFGDGKEPIPDGLWVVLESHPDDVIDLGGKVKFVPHESGDTDAEGKPICDRVPEVIYRGALPGAMQLIMDGHRAWIKHISDGAPASSSGPRAPASSSGDGAPASSSGYGAPASSSGYGAPASSSGYGAPAKATGERSVAASTGEKSSVEAGSEGVAVTTADDCWWVVHEGAVFVQRWKDRYRLVTADEIGAKTGDRVHFLCGEITEHIRKEADCG